MRLLNTRTLKLHYFVADIPEYVILSHTWGEEEVLLEDIDKPEVCKMIGYTKILQCCQQAKEDGFEWVWIDTCCIDKKSSAELTEAINSMYKWYWEAATCYAYLADVTDVDDSSFERSRWFTRGWTLQELLAPSIVEFYTQNWRRLGSRIKLANRLACASNIERCYLLDRRLVSTASIATRFSWASLRQTTRPEDIAYCLLGLVGINMPMLYGEGAHAFHRLQLELIKQSNEHSIFTWHIHGSPSHASFSAILAQSPEPFQSSANIRSIYPYRPAANMNFEMTNSGLRISLPCVPISQNRMVAILDCENGDGERLGIWLERSGDGQFHRLPNSDLSVMKARDIDDAELREFYVRATRDLSPPIAKEHAYDIIVNCRQIDQYGTATAARDFPRQMTGSSGVLKSFESGSFHRFVLASHTIQHGSGRPWFTVFIGWHNNAPTIRCVGGGYFSSFTTWDPSKTQILESLTKENAKYSRDYYRAPLCCGNFVEIELRKVHRHKQTCWTFDVRIEGRPSLEEELDPSFQPPSTCTGVMSLDGTLAELRKQ
ncbi:hypothetical protein OPT61_g4222 [Boeremia exigua]|uniref:Uncharacterized protein n=1 Tax=Boeremia exigua TaxID=749465 RepID=A0ACC2IEV6_9PLEO|nr:hypothetical protein OPT61_g4222 [Boeremia exigua]